MLATKDAGVTSHNDAGLYPDTYYYRVRHYYGTSYSDYSSNASGEIVAEGATSGGTAAFAWSAPSGVADNNSITVTSNSQTFTQPTKQIYLGFGMGWLYDQADDTALPSSITVGGESFTRQSPNSALVTRTVRTQDGMKTIYANLKPGGAAQPYSAVCLNWDTGGEITSSDTIYAYRLSRLHIQSRISTFQWKQIRFRPNANVQENGDTGGNEIYCARGSSGSNWSRVVATLGAAGDESYTTQLPTDEGGWSAFGIVWKPNAVDQTDGVCYTHLVDNTRKNFTRATPTGSGGTANDTIQSDSTYRPRYVMIQDDIANSSGNQDFQIDSTDHYWKLNGDLFLLADSSDLSTCTEPPVPLVPTSFNSASSWTFNLWKGAMTTYSGKYIHRLSALLEPLQVVAL